MTRYVAERLFQALLTLLLLSAIIFFLSRVLGDPVMFLLPMDARQDDVDRLREIYGFNRPLIVQYLDMLGQMLQGDFGESLRLRDPVIDLIAERWLASVQLILIGMSWAIVAALILGVLSAVYRGRPIDWIARTLAVIGQSAPSFWIGLILIQLFSVRLEWLPSAGYGGFAHMVLPSFALGVFALAGMTRLLRSSMLDVLDSDYVKKARIMGVPEWRVITKHALKNAILPVLTFAGEYFALLVTAGVVVETVYAWPGMGTLAVDAVVNRDFPLIQGVTTMIAVIVMSMNLIVDLLYASIDPRIRLGRR
ncbi:MAG: ABC transporter permease [Alphaproteobacteria bacterium]|nr:ABC transporter permease [Alphaproteobacteria bacterium]